MLSFSHVVSHVILLRVVFQITLSFYNYHISLSFLIIVRKEHLSFIENTAISRIQAKSVDVAVSRQKILIFYVNTFVSTREKKLRQPRADSIRRVRSRE